MKLWVRCKFRRWKVGFLGIVEAVVVAVVVVRGAAAGVAVVVVVHLRWWGLEIAGASPGLPNCCQIAKVWITGVAGIPKSLIIKEEAGGWWRSLVVERR